MPEVGFISQRAETQEQWEARMACEAIAVTRSELYLDFRFFDAALNVLTPTAAPGAVPIGTDGSLLYVQPRAVLRLFRENPKYLDRLMLHTVLHCLFRHLWLIGRRDPALWGLACDICVEYAIDHCGKKSVTRPLTWLRINTYDQLTATKQPIAAVPVYRWLAVQSTGALQQLRREFHADDHGRWPKAEEQQTPQAIQAQQTWQKLGKRAETESELHAHDEGSGGEAVEQQLSAALRSRRSYREFLRKFCILREEARLDPDSFDLNFYTYGLSLYGNMPLIEPQETREAFKVAELALIVDTSYSTSGALVQAFLRETYGLLKQRESFFTRIHLRLIQADDRVQKDEKITTEAELVQAMEHFTLRGGGGTDFRPAFRYVDYLCEQKQFQNLKGLLYFTDGLGKYPEKRPAYETAFLFLGDRFDDTAVPPWAMKLVLDEEEFLPAAAPAGFAEGADEDYDALRDLNNT